MITSLAAVVVAGGGVAVGQAIEAETAAPVPAVAPPAPMSAPLAPALSPADCARLFGPLPEASGKSDPEKIVYLGECNYGEATITVTP